ncbi:TetR/AcrR family transcriptional regulator [Stappia sp. WLB 29]|uniref:TetR/AcrR family transcriptional regulator n=1 Tax=Stappia sp. WLB 29 TaxID=2925220 RepID=UPI0020BD5EE1|nr:TetR/AcrR family transcriptional regulator [Stappia sp. WLB 29]
MGRHAKTQANRDEVRVRILQVAEEHFRRAGHYKTSVAAIACELGMSRANVYRFFPTREAIITAVCRQTLDDVVARAFTIARSSASAHQNLLCILVTIHNINKERLASDRHMHDLIVSTMQKDEAALKKYIGELNLVLELVIRSGVKAGEFEIEDSAVTARVATSFFVSLLNPLLFEYCFGDQAASEKFLRIQIRHFLRAVENSCAT